MLINLLSLFKEKKKEFVQVYCENKINFASEGKLVMRLGKQEMAAQTY